MRRTKLAGPPPLCLASLPDAAEQQAEVVVRSLGPQAVRIATHRVTPVPTEHVPFGRIQTAREAFRYDARAETTPQAEPAIVVTAVDRAAPPAWVWDSEIRSRIAADGTAEHLMTYEIENAGSAADCPEASASASLRRCSQRLHQWEALGCNACQRGRR